MNDHMELTGWMPCTMPPVRGGVYEVDMKGCNGSNPILCEFAAGEWPGRPGINKFLDDWKWRGVRRWVLIEAINRPALSVTRVSKYKFSFGPLVRAIGFDSKKEAEAFAAKHPRYNLKAVLP